MTTAASSTPGAVALLFGSTGAVGKPLLTQLLDSPHYSTVYSFVRRTSGIDHPKLREEIIDFDQLLEQGNEGPHAEKIASAKANDVYITLGTTRAQAGSAAAFEKIDRDFVLAAARAARSSSVTPQKVLYCSSQMADSSSRFLYIKSKGLTEEGLAALGYDEAIIFRPGLLAQANREKTRLGESVYAWFTGNVLSRFSDGAEIPVSLLATSMIKAATLGSSAVKAAGLGIDPPAPFKRHEGASSIITVIKNAEAARLAKKE